MGNIPSTQSDILKIIGEHPTRAIVKVGEVVPRAVILLLLNSTMVPLFFFFTVLLSISPKPVSGFFQLYCTQGVLEFSLNHRHKDLPESP